MTDDVGEAVIRIRTDESGFDPGSAGKKAGDGYAKGFGGAIRGLGVAMAGALAAAGVGSFLKGAITGASDLQETVSKTGVVFGKAADDILAFSDKGAAALGLSKQAALDAAGTFGVFGKAAGLTGKDLSSFSTDLVSLSTDLASFHNAEPEEVVEALGAALRGEAEPMRRFGVLLDDASLKAEALKMGLISTTKDALTPQQKTLAAQSLIMKQTADAQGDFERTSGGLANQQRILGATFKDLQAKIGTAFLPVALAAVKGVLSLLDAAGSLEPVIDRVGQVFANVFAGGGGGEFFSTLADQARLLLPVIQEVASSIGPALLGIGQSIATNVLPVLQQLGQFIVTQVVPAAMTFGEYVITNLVPVFVSLANIIATQVVPTLATIATFIVTQVYPAVFSIVTAVGENLKPVFDTLVDVFLTRVLPTLQKAVEQIRTQLIPALQPLIMTVIKVVGVFYRVASAVLGFVLPPLIRLAGFIISKVVPVVISVITWVAKFVGGLIRLGVNIGQAIGRFAAFHAAIVRGVINAVSSVVSTLAGLPGKILGFVGRLVSAGKSLIGGLLRGMKNAATGVGGFIGDVASSVLNAVKDAINSVIDLANDAIPNKLGKGPISVDLPDNPIPRLQSGTSSAAGGVYTVGEVGPERVYVPEGARVLTAAQTRQADARGGIDYDALALALASVLGPLLSGQRPVQFVLPSGDPEAAAMAAVNRLATVE